MTTAAYENRYQLKIIRGDFFPQPQHNWTPDHRTQADQTMAWWPELMQKTAARYDSIAGTKRPYETHYVCFPEQVGYKEPLSTVKRSYSEPRKATEFSDKGSQTKTRMSESTEGSEDAPAQSWLDSGDDRGNSLEAIRYRINRAAIEKAYANFVDPFVTENNGHEIAGEHLLECVLVFARKKRP